MTGSVHEASAVDACYLLNSVILLRKDRRPKEKAWRLYLPKFGGPRNICEITIKTTIFAVTHQVEKRSLHGWLLIRMLGTSLMSR